ncbi:MAG: D-Ala-D-Ala carboxypeptidase family metallohydrolase [Woeseia sp.]
MNATPSWPNFTLAEFACRCGCGHNLIEPNFVDMLQLLRSEVGRPFIITSGYRCLDHPLEVVKQKPGAHTLGVAADIYCGPTLCREILRHTLRHPAITGIGISQKPRKRFIHLDMAASVPLRPRPALWTY